VKFAITYQRALMGNDIDIQIDAETNEVISAVKCTLDGSEIASDDFSQTPIVSFHRSLSHTGEAGPGQVHKLMVEVQGESGEASKFASRIWSDAD
jgi:hypothetical protein